MTDEEIYEIAGNLSFKQKELMMKTELTLNRQLVFSYSSDMEKVVFLSLVLESLGELWDRRDGKRVFRYYYIPDQHLVGRLSEKGKTVVNVLFEQEKVRAALNG